MDFVYYPEFLHDIFCIRLYLNFVFFSTFFEKSGFFFSHFEIFYKYNFLAVRVFYYDGVLMTGVHTFNADFFNRFYKRSYLKAKRRSRRLLGSRIGRIFLGLFYSFFSFSDFFRPSFVKNIHFKEGLVDFRKFHKFHNYPLGPLLANKKVPRVAKLRALKRAIPFERDMRLLRRYPADKFFNYDFLFELKYFKMSRWLLFKALHKRRRFLKRKSTAGGKHKPYKRKPYDLNDLDNIAIPGRGKVRFLLLRTLRRLKRSMKWHLKFKSRTYQRRFRKKLRYIFYTIGRFCNMGEFSKVLQHLRKLFYLSFPLQMEFNFFFIFIILFRRLWHLLQSDSRQSRLFDFLADFYFVTSFLFFYNGYSFRFFYSFVNCVLHFIVPKLTLKIGIFLISNDSVSARFLSSFVGKKLLQGHRVRATMHPIMRDLHLVSKGVKFTKFNIIDRVDHDGFSSSFRHSVIKSFVLKFFFVFRRLFSKFFFFCSSWINCYFFGFMVVFLELFLLRPSILVGASKKFMSKRHGFLFFFNFDFSFFNSNLFFTFNEIFFDFSCTNVTNSLFFFLFLMIYFQIIIAYFSGNFLGGFS